MSITFLLFIFHSIILTCNFNHGFLPLLYSQNTPLLHLNFFHYVLQGAGDAPDKFTNAVDDLKKEKDKLEASLKSNKDILNQLTVTYDDVSVTATYLYLYHSSINLK